MTLLRTLACAALITAVGTTAIAQTKPSAAGPDGAPLVTPSGMTAPRPTQANTPASASGLVMTPQEREQQRRDLERAKTGDECRAVVEKQRQQLAQRARERGEPAPSKPATDPCVGR